MSQDFLVSQIASWSSAAIDGILHSRPNRTWEISLDYPVLHLVCLVWSLSPGRGDDDRFEGHE